jgi:hypothetical protein
MLLFVLLWGSSSAIKEADLWIVSPVDSVAATPEVASVTKVIWLNGCGYSYKIGFLIVAASTFDWYSFLRHLDHLKKGNFSCFVLLTQFSSASLVCRIDGALSACNTESFCSYVLMEGVNTNGNMVIILLLIYRQILFLYSPPWIST